MEVIHKEQPTSPPQKSRWRISLRTAFILLTLACFALVYIGRAERQRRVVAQLNQWGYECEFTSRFGKEDPLCSWAVEPKPSEPFYYYRGVSSRRGALDHYLENIRAVHPTHHDEFVDWNAPKDFSLEIFSQLPGLEYLSVHTRGIGDADLKPLARLHSLRCLDLNLRDVTDAGLVHVAPLTQLMGLRLPPGISNAGIKELAPLTNLISLTVPDSSITDAGLAEIAKHTQLETLYLPKAKSITGSGLGSLAKLPRLRAITLYDAPLRDESLAHLANFPSLEFVGLDGCPISDQGAIHLGRCKRVRNLYLNGTKITDRGVAELVKLPELEDLGLNVAGVTDQGALLLKQAPELYHHSLSKDVISQEVRDEVSQFLSDRAHDPNFRK